MATLIAVELVAPELGIIIRPPDDAFLDRVFDLDATRWSLLQDPYKYEAAAWVYAAIGFDGWWELARRAEDLGLERIPREWVVLPPSAPLSVNASREGGSARTIVVGRPPPDE